MSELLLEEYDIDMELSLSKRVRQGSPQSQMEKNMKYSKMNMMVQS